MYGPLPASGAQPQQSSPFQPQSRNPTAANGPPFLDNYGNNQNFTGEIPIFSEYFEWDLVNLWK